MRSRTGKLFALTSAVLCLGVLVLAGFAAKPWLEEEWYLHKLETGSQEEREEASQRLASLSSLHGLTRLIDLARRTARDSSERYPALFPVLTPLAKVGGARAVANLLDGQDRESSLKVVEALVSIAWEDRTMSPALLPCLENSHSEVRQRAIELTKIGPSGTRELEALMRCLRDPDSEVREAAKRTLSNPDYDGPLRASAFAALSRDDSSEMRKTGVELLGSLSESPLGSADPVTRTAVQALMARLKDLETEVRDEAIHSLERFGPEAEATIPALIDTAKGADENLRVSVRCALRAIKAAVVQPMIQALSHEDAVVRLVAVEVLHDLEEKPLTVVPPLRRALGDGDPRVRKAAASVLGGLGPNAREAADDLERLLEDRHESVRCAAASAFWDITQREGPVVSVLMQTVKSRDENRFRRSIWTLAEIGPKARAAIPVLTELLQDKSCYHRLEAASALAEIEEDPGRVLPEIKKALGHSCWGGCSDRALTILGRLGAKAQPILPALVEALKDDAEHTREYAAHALGRIGPEARAAVPALREALEDGNFSVHDAVESALRKIQPR